MWFRPQHVLDLTRQLSPAAFYLLFAAAAVVRLLGGALRYMLPRKREVVAGKVEDLQKKTRAEEEINKADDTMAWRVPEIDEDLHSHQLAGYGRETMKRLFGSNVLVSGLQDLGAEIENSRRQQDSQWLATLSETELDLLISLKELAAKRAKNAGHPRLADKFDLRTLRALGIVLLESFKERLKETSVDPNFFDRLTLLSDSDADFTNSGSDSKVVRPNEDQQTPIGVMRK